eukprot:5499631-Amphidinium_carterae.1
MTVATLAQSSDLPGRWWQTRDPPSLKGSIPWHGNHTKLPNSWGSLLRLWPSNKDAQADGETSRSRSRVPCLLIVRPGRMLLAQAGIAPHVVSATFGYRTTCFACNSKGPSSDSGLPVSKSGGPASKEDRLPKQTPSLRTRQEIS